MTHDEEVKTAFAEFHQVLFDKLLNALIAKVDARARSEEREACAVAAEKWIQWTFESSASFGYSDLGNAIRARGEQ
jgi:hypothetical protein